MQFKRNEPLIVIHANYGVVVAARRVIKQAIGRKRSHGRDAFSPRLAHSRRDHFDLLVAEDPFFAAVRIERRNRDARPGDAEKILETALRQFQRGLNIFPSQIARDLGECDVTCYRHHAKLGPDEHHAALGRTAQFGQQFRMTGIIVARVDEDALADRRRGHGIGDLRQRQFSRDANIAKRAMAAVSGWLAWPGLPGAERRE